MGMGLEWEWDIRTLEPSDIRHSTFEHSDMGRTWVPWVKN